MAVSDFFWTERNGASPGTQTPSGTPPIGSLVRADFLSLDETSNEDSNNYKNHPIIVPVSGTAYSFEKWISIYWNFNGSNQITNVKFWKSSGTLSHADLLIKFGVVNRVTPGYATPVNTQSSKATSDVSTSEPGTQNVTLDGGGNTITGSAYSDYLVLQLHVPNTVDVPGDVGTQEFTCQYDES